jgi:hypothetical protein
MSDEATLHHRVTVGRTERELDVLLDGWMPLVGSSSHTLPVVVLLGMGEPRQAAFLWDIANWSMT